MQPAAHFQAAQIGEADVEEDQIGLSFRGQREGVGTDAASRTLTRLWASRVTLTSSTTVGSSSTMSTVAMLLTWCEKLPGAAAHPGGVFHGEGDGGAHEVGQGAQMPGQVPGGEPLNPIILVLPKESAYCNRPATCRRANARARAAMARA